MIGANSDAAMVASPEMLCPLPDPAKETPVPSRGRSVTRIFCAAPAIMEA